MSGTGDGRGRVPRWLLIGTPLAVLAVIVLVWFQPQALLIDTRVDDALPGGAADGTAATNSDPTPTAEMNEGDAAAATPTEQMTEDDAAETPTPEPPSGPVVLAAGEFQSRAHTTTGTAVAYELEDGTRTLRLEDLATDNGPDLFVYLSAADPDAPEATLDDDFVDLGRLKGNLGNQNYDLAADVDLSHYRTVVIWCRRFTTAFGSAELTG